MALHAVGPPPPLRQLLTHLLRRVRGLRHLQLPPLPSLSYHVQLLDALLLPPVHPLIPHLPLPLPQCSDPTSSFFDFAAFTSNGSNGDTGRVCGG